jgi:FkbM family methyltransferase
MSSEILGTVVETRQGVFCVDPEDRFISKSLIERGEYAPDEIMRVGNFLRPGSKVLLVGAHIGALLVPLSRRVDSLVGIEANPKTFKRLKLNLLLNQCRNVRVFNVAASEAPGSLEFVMNRENSGASKRMPLVKNRIYFYDNPEVGRVPAARLDDLLPEDTFDLVFMDIEGSELFAMRGMPRILASAQVVFCEFYPFMIREVAGADVEAFLAPLAEYRTLAIPSLQKVVHDADIRPALQEMFENNKCDNGIIFTRRKTNLQFAS